MRKINFMATTIAIALCATVGMTSCKNNAAPKEPEGEKMGNVRIVQKDNGIKHIVLADGYEEQTDYTTITDHKDFLVATSEDMTHLLNLDGGEFAVCDSFVVKDIYPVKSGETTSKYIELVLSSGNHAARSYAKPHASLTNLTGVKEEVYPLSNGWIIYKMKGLYSFAKADAENGVMDPVFKEISAVSVKDKIYFLVKSSDFTGYVDSEGNGVKSLAPAAYKAAKKSGKQLWSAGVVSGIEKANL